MLRRFELAVNGGFESSDFTGWTPPNFNYMGVVNDLSLAHSGTAFMYAQPPEMDFLVQALNTIPGLTSQLTFWLRTYSSGAAPNGKFAVVLEPAPAGDVTVATQGDPNAAPLNPDQSNPGTLTLSATTAFGWTRYQVSFVASASATTLKFGFQMTDQVYWLLDDVSVASDPCTDDSQCSNQHYCHSGRCDACSVIQPHW